MFPINGIGGYACPPSTQCPPGSSAPSGCPAGTYNPSFSVAYCPACPAGAYCPGNSTYPGTCPLHYYCPSGTTVPLLCPNGTYGHARNLSSASACAVCPPGSYCDDGTVTGLCSAGYFCRDGQKAPSPKVDLSGVSSISNQLTILESLRGGPCPPGHYCPVGTSEPIPCSLNTVRISLYGTNQSGCGGYHKPFFLKFL